MDNLTHSLVGATLAHTGLRRLTPLGTATLVIGANLPDVDIIAGAFGSDTSLSFRRGWTHGVLAMVVAPLLLTLGLLAYDRYLRRRRAPGAEPARPGPLLLLAVLGVLSHPLFDWLNNYGVRWLMPLSGEWFYGDAVFIIDPWLWLAGAAAPVLATRSVGGLVAWSAAGVVGTVLMFASDLTPPATRVLWVVGVALLALARVARRVDAPERLALVASCFLALYPATLWSLSAEAERRALAAGLTSGAGDAAVVSAHASPMPADPLAWDVILEAGPVYRFATVHLLTGAVTESNPAVPRAPLPESVREALARPEHRGFSGWLRFPTWRFDTEREPPRIVIQDVRYSRFRRAGFGTIEVPVPSRTSSSEASKY